LIEVLGMFAIGLVVGLALFIATGFWYRQPNSRFSSRILGRDVDEPQGTVQFLRGAAQETVRVLRASRTPSLDAVVERDRQLMSRRYRILAGLVLTFVCFPLLFELLGLVIPVLLRGGAAGVLFIAFALALLLYSAFGIAKPVIAYGNGEPLELRFVVTSALRIAAVAAVLVAILALAAR
jgi:hypothetical protein